jgi:hypothetical protein
MIESLLLATKSRRPRRVRVISSAEESPENLFETSWDKVIFFFSRPHQEHVVAKRYFAESPFLVYKFWSFP